MCTHSVAQLPGTEGLVPSNNEIVDGGHPKFSFPTHPGHIGAHLFIFGGCATVYISYFERRKRTQFDEYKRIHLYVYVMIISSIRCEI